MFILDIVVLFLFQSLFSGGSRGGKDQQGGEASSGEGSQGVAKGDQGDKIGVAASSCVGGGSGAGTSSVAPSATAKGKDF